MATVSVLVARPIAGAQMTMVLRDGTKIPIRAPREFASEETATFEEISRSGMKPFRRKTGLGLASHSFDQMVTKRDWTEDVEYQIERFRQIAREGTPFRLSGGSSTEGGRWFTAEKMTVKVTQRTPAGKIARASLSWQLVEEVEADILKVGTTVSPPGSTKPGTVKRVGSLTVVPAGSTASVGVQRAHTYAAGENLWDLAERYLGDPLRWEEIVRINPTKIPNPDRIKPGTVLQIPRK